MTDAPHTDAGTFPRRVLALINARGNSKGIPRKNIKLLLGKPLIAYAIEAALGSSFIKDVIVSTDDDEIAEVASRWGAQVPFRRPAELATDTAAQFGSTLHALEWLRTNRNDTYEFLVLLQPTAPLRTSGDIDGALQILFETQADSVVSFTAEGTKHPYYMYEIEDGRPKPFIDGKTHLQRQDFPKVFIRNGAIYALKTGVTAQYGNIYGKDCRAYLMPAERSINIDSPFDWALAEFVLGRLLGNQP